VKRKLPHTATVEELLKVIEDQETPISEEHDIVNYPTLENDIVAFLSFYEIEPGNDPVPKTMLYKLYCLWSKEPITRKQFACEINKFVLVTHKGSQASYLLNKSSLKLTQEAYSIINSHTRDYTKSPGWRKHFEEFLASTGIKKGDWFIENHILYNLYDEYSYNTKKKARIGPIQFIRFCNLYFPEKITANKEKWYGVNRSLETVLTPERLATLREQHGKKTNKKK